MENAMLQLFELLMARYDELVLENQKLKDIIDELYSGGDDYDDYDDDGDYDDDYDDDYYGCDCDKCRGI